MRAERRGGGHTYVSRGTALVDPWVPFTVAKSGISLVANVANVIEPAFVRIAVPVVLLELVAQ